MRYLTATAPPIDSTAARAANNGNMPGLLRAVMGRVCSCNSVPKEGLNLRSTPVNPSPPTPA
eukprot:CAMPEP_0185910992 /NCGR_PEP_ID=MMETSP0196C-20130402/23658_1 /TAXON_ID=2932 /ORGANISM="Alexandrium fundyense, Strain CCMP1719" /LENGTH=61 /DNA_ID=CAMNT_0028631903 /DNA_START=147 /DNA_END=332 /DNA_ORIENTATION=-